MPRQNSHQPPLPCIHWHHLHALADGDEHFALALLRSFLADGDRQVSELRRVIDQGDYQQAHHYTHQIKGASANVGALQVQAIITQIELYLQTSISSKPDLPKSDLPKPDLPKSDLPKPEKPALSSGELSRTDLIASCLTELEKAIAQIRSIVLERSGDG